MPEKSRPKKISRRTFMKGAAIAGAILAMNPVTPPALASDLLKVNPNAPKALGPQTAPRRQLIQQVLYEASRTKNMPATIEKYGTSLSPQEKNILLSLTPADLAALESIYKRIPPF
jgi:hypothetical protein